MNTEFLFKKVEFEDPSYPVIVRFGELNPDYKNSEAELFKFGQMVIVIINSGALRIIADGRVENISAGEGLLINIGVECKCHLTSVEPCSYYVMAFDPQFVFSSKSMYRKYCQPFTENSNIKLIKFSEDNLRDETVLDSINRIIAVNMAHKPNYELITLNILCAMWINFLEYTKEGNVVYNGKNVPGADEKRVKAGIKYIEENYQDMVTLVDIAEHVHLSDSECCRCFKRVLDKSPVNYLIEYRVFMAVKILFKNPEAAESMSDLCFKTGFNNPSYFNKIFKRFVGCTPTEYRKYTKKKPDVAERIYINLQEELTVL
ncbi:MAG: AraC family transcriptional regulator [Lachnospiraceae bacterium]|nr:AraC family transcriptional regulator [Lachnospiraceae bacterium]